MIVPYIEVAFFGCSLIIVISFLFSFLVPICKMIIVLDVFVFATGIS